MFRSSANALGYFLVRCGTASHGILKKTIEQFSTVRRSSAVKSKGKFIQVAVKVFGTHGSLMGTQNPPLGKELDKDDFIVEFAVRMVVEGGIALGFSFATRLVAKQAATAVRPFLNKYNALLVKLVRGTGQAQANAIRNQIVTAAKNDFMISRIAEDVVIKASGLAMTQELVDEVVGRFMDDIVNAVRSLVFPEESQRSTLS